MNLASALIKQIILLQDFETWSFLRLQYLPREFESIFKIIESHCDQHHSLPTFGDLKYSIRDAASREKLYAIEAVDAMDLDPALLLQYIKNEYFQQELFYELEDFIENSVAFESAEESVEHLQRVIVQVSDKVDLEKPQESMGRINLFDNEKELSRYLALGLNSDFDAQIQFAPEDLILMGGPKGSGKSVTCTNIANNIINSGRSVLHFSIEMDTRVTLQRACSVATEVPFMRLRTRNLDNQEWLKVAKWWASRFDGGEERFEEYLQHRDFDRFHTSLITKHELTPDKQLQIIYDPGLTVTKIRTEVEKRMSGDLDVGIVIVDYLNQVSRGKFATQGLYDWKEQIEVAKELKRIAQEFEVTVFSPYQIDASGEARFSKGILDSPDAAYKLNSFEEEDACMSFTCEKMRNGPKISFTSAVNWPCIKIGPESALTPKEREEIAQVDPDDVDDDIVPF